MDAVLSVFLVSISVFLVVYPCVFGSVHATSRAFVFSCAVVCDRGRRCINPFTQRTVAAGSVDPLHPPNIDDTAFVHASCGNTPGCVIRHADNEQYKHTLEAKRTSASGCLRIFPVACSNGAIATGGRAHRIRVVSEDGVVGAIGEIGAIGAIGWIGAPKNSYDC